MISQDAVNAQKQAPYIAGDESTAHHGTASLLVRTEDAVAIGLAVGTDWAIDSHSSTHGTASSASSQKDHLHTQPQASVCKM